jgi:GxxExxY protein
MKSLRRSLVVALQQARLKVSQQYPIKVAFENVVVGEFFADLFVENKVLVELKAVSILTQEHTAQALNDLRATGVEVCLLINLGKPKTEIKRLLPSVYWKTPTL